MIDIEQLERLAKLAVGDQSIQVPRDDLLFLINRYRELPDLSQEERSEIGDIPGLNPEPGLTQPERQARKCQTALRDAKLRLEVQRNNVALFVECPDCHAGIGRTCGASGHVARLTAAFDELRRHAGLI